MCRIPSNTSPQQNPNRNEPQTKAKKKNRKKTQEKKRKIPSFYPKKKSHSACNSTLKHIDCSDQPQTSVGKRKRSRSAHTTGQPEKDTPNVREHNKRSERPQTCEETTGDGPSGETETPGHPVPCHTRAKACVVLLLTSS